MKDGILENAMNAFKIESESLIKTMEAIDPEQFAAVVDALAKAERIAAAGCGHSGIACQHFAHLMCCIDRPARFISPADPPDTPYPINPREVTNKPGTCSESIGSNEGEELRSIFCRLNTDTVLGKCLTSVS